MEGGSHCVRCEHTCLFHTYTHCEAPDIFLVVIVHLTCEKVREILPLIKKQCLFHWLDNGRIHVINLYTCVNDLASTCTSYNLSLPPCVSAVWFPILLAILENTSVTETCYKVIQKRSFLAEIS